MFEKERPMRRKTGEAMNMIESEKENPAFWLKYPELLMSDDFLELFQDSLRELTGGAEWLVVFRNRGRFRFSIEESLLGSIFTIEPDHREANPSHSSFIVPAYWSYLMEAMRRQKPSWESQLVAVKKRQKAPETKPLGSPKRNAAAWVCKEEQLEKKLAEFEEDMEKYRIRMERAEEIAAFMKCLSPILQEAGYRTIGSR